MGGERTKGLGLTMLTMACRLSPESQQICVAHVEDLKMAKAIPKERRSCPGKEQKVQMRRVMPEQSQEESE